MTLGKVINQRNGMCGLCEYDYEKQIPQQNPNPNPIPFPGPGPNPV